MQVCFIESFKWLQLEVSSVIQAINISSSDVGETEKRVTFDDSPTPSINEETRIGRCFDCCNLINSWIPITKPEWLFEERWKSKATGEIVERYHVIEKERESHIMRNVRA